MKWYYFEDRKCKGPVEEAVLKERLEQGSVEGTVPVRTDAMENWIPLSEAVDLFGRLPGPPKREASGEIPQGYTFTPSAALAGDGPEPRDLIFGLARGLFVGLAGGWIWAMISIASEAQFGFMAIFVGLLTGLAVRLFGDPESFALGITAALSAFAGIFFGNFLVVLNILAAETGLSLSGVWNELGFRGLLDACGIFTTPVDFVFYGIGTFAAFKTAMTKNWVRK